MSDPKEHLSPVWKHLTEALVDYAEEQQINGALETFERVLRRTNV